MLDANLKTQLKAYLEKVTRPIVITASLDDSDSSKELQALLADLVSLSDRISVTESHDGDERKPSFALGTPGQDIHLRFAGLPLGHEFTSLVLALLQVGGHPSKLGQDLIEQIRGLDGEYVFETYFSLSCQNCPDVVQALNLMSVLNPNIRHVAIDGALFQQEVEAREVMSVPTIFLNGQVFGAGRMGVEEIVAKLDTGAASREAAKIKAKAPYEVLVIGGGPPARRRRSMPRARASAPAWRPSASAARCWTPWRSRTSFRCPTPKAPSWRPRWNSTSRTTAST